MFTNASVTPFLNAVQNGFESSTRVGTCLIPRPTVLITMPPPAALPHELTFEKILYQFDSKNAIVYLYTLFSNSSTSSLI